jgi:acyl-CoA synthetase (AMP-forming)/AMP-acid ligase II
MSTQTYKSSTGRKYDDGIDLNKQTVEIDPVEHIRRCTLYKDIDIWSYYKSVLPRIRTLGDVLDHGHAISKDGPCFGFVQSENRPEPVRWLSYSMVSEQTSCIGSHLWTKTKLIPTHSKVAIISLNRPEYVFVEYACYMYGFIVVGLFTSYDPKTIMNLLRKTQTEVLVVDNLERIRSFEKQLLENDQIKEIIVMDEVKDGEHGKIRSLPSILKAMDKADIRPRPTLDPDSIATFLLTSGTTGEREINASFVFSNRL